MGPRQGQPLVTGTVGSGQAEEHRQEGAGSPPSAAKHPVTNPTALAWPAAAPRRGKTGSRSYD